MADLEPLARKYFEVWNSQDLGELAKLFTPGATLRDWDIEKEGRDAVVEANGGIFKAVPGIKIEVLRVHVSPGTSAASCEILVKLNDGTDTVLKVVDIIEYEGDLIKAVRAFKG
mmetsp:Transcript_92875/g.200800  ORF Transcript_92875/g.200800 Transcript_92875/m.200800 type:complete len:114 (-) Transcript_92875:53-394(-)